MNPIWTILGIQPRGLVEILILGNMLLELGLANPVVDLDLNTYPCIGFEKISHHLQYSAWNPSESSSPANGYVPDNRNRTKIDWNTRLRVIYGIA